jgi:CO dehydrogenase/acetyl-CoA synthase alpha subunit
MMNIVALGLLLSSLGSVMILSREPLLVKDPADAGNEANVLLVKEVRRRPGENNNSNDVDDTAPAAVGRRLKRVAEAAYKPVTEAVEALNRKTEEIVDSNKEKVAKAAETVSSNNKKTKSSPDKLSFWTSRKKQDTSADDHLLAAKEKAAAASQAFEEATRLLEDATREKLAALHEVSPEGILQRTGT